MSSPLKYCPKCENELPRSQFTQRPNGRWSSYCKACLSLYCRHHYTKNAALHNARRAVARRRYRARNRAPVVGYLRTHPCVDCGESDPIVLEFDHVDPHEKEFEVSTLSNGGRSLELLNREMDRCVVRCAKCHRRGTARQFDWGKGIRRYPGCSSAW